MYTTEQFREQVYLWYDTNGITVGDPSVGRWEHAHIVPKCEGGTETVLLLKEHHYIHDLYQSREYNRCCFFAGTTRAWLYGEGFLCENWFELVSLYEYYIATRNAQICASRWSNATEEERQRQAEALHLGLAAYWTDETRRDRGIQQRERMLANSTPEELSAEMSRRRSAGWETKSPEERQAATRKAREARWAKATPEDRSAGARRAVEARWAKVRAERALRSLGAETYGAMWADDTL